MAELHHDDVDIKAHAPTENPLATTPTREPSASDPQQASEARLSTQDLSAAQTFFRQLLAALQGAVRGQEAALESLIIALLSGGHVLLQGVPGVGKTLSARALAQCLDLQFRRVQFTPDLMPADLLGTLVYDNHSGDWSLHKGPVFTQILLADEINRTPPKTQAALLEAMQERQVSVEGQSHPLGADFFVVATQNPVELEGTYPLPEAQTDRFLLRVEIGYPAIEDEAALLADAAQGITARLSQLRPLANTETLAALRALLPRIFVDASVRQYVLALVQATRRSRLLRLGASPRAGLALLQAARSRALCHGRNHVLPDDVKALAASVLAHRLVLAPEAELDGRQATEIVATLLRTTEVPR